MDHSQPAGHVAFPFEMPALLRLPQHGLENGKRFRKPVRPVIGGKFGVQHLPEIRGEAPRAVQVLERGVPFRLLDLHVAERVVNRGVVGPLLQQLDMQVTTLTADQFGTADLSRYGAIVVGPRAFAATPVLAAQAPRLQAFARAGGTVVVQYGQQEMQVPGLLPYPITLERTAQRPPAARDFFPWFSTTS